MKQVTASSDGAVSDRSMTQVLLSDEEQARRIRRLVGMVRRRRGFIAAATVAIFLVACIAIMLAPREYTAEASIALDPRKTGIVDIAAAVISSLPADIEGIATEVQVLQAPSLVSRVLAKLSQPSSAPRADISTPVAETMMQRLSALAAELRQAMWGTEPMFASAEPEATDYDGIKRFLRHLTVEQLVHSRVIKVSYGSNDPGEAARIVNTLVDLYLADQVTLKKAATEEAHRWIDERLDGLRRGVRDVEQSASDFRTEHHLNIGRDEVRLTEQQLIDLTTRLIQVRTRRAHIDAQLGEAERLSEAKADSSAISGVLQSPTVSRLREQEAEVARELARGRETYGQNAPKMLELAAGLADTEQKIKRETSRILGDIRSQAAKVRGEEASIARAISDAESRIGAENGAAIQLRELEEEAGAQRQVLKTFLERSNETGAASYQAPDGRVVSYAAVPSEPSRPKLPLYFYLAFGAALCTATCLGFVRELLDDRIRSDEHILALGAAPLGTMPVVRHRTRPVHESLAERPFSALGESIRGLVTSLFIHGTGDENVISVTSSLPGEGKTTVVMAIARLVAMTRHRVLVIDCDMHRPRLHRELGMTEQPGLAEVLAGKLSGADAVIHDTATGIDLMPAGTDRYADLYNTGSFLLFYGRLHDFIASVRSRYDLVVMDCGPVLAVSDARVISHLADATVFIARWGQTRKAHAAAGLQQLRDARVNIAGVFLTMGNVKKQSRFSDLPAYHRLLRKYYLQ